MKIRFFFPQTSKSEKSGGKSIPPTAIYYLSSILKQNGHHSDVYDSNWPESLGNSFVEGLITDCDVVAISANTFNWRFAKEFAETAKRCRKDLVIVAGGIHPTLVAHQNIGNLPFDYIVRGEGEQALPNLINTLDQNGNIDSVLGISILRGGRISHNPDQPLLSSKELSSQPVPDFSMLPPGKYLALTTEPSRGCIHNCGFCSIPYRKQFRGVSVDKFIARLEETLIVGRDKIKLFSSKIPVLFLDDCFTTQESRAIQILERTASMSGSIKIGIEARADQITTDISRALSMNDFFVIQLGLESGYQKGLNLIGKKLRLEDMEMACSRLKRQSLEIYSNCAFILGFPWEGKEECLATLRFAEKLIKNFGINVSASWFEMLPGSLFWRKMNTFGIQVDLSIFDNSQIDFRHDLEIFHKTHPRLEVQDILEIEESVLRLAEKNPRFLTNFPFVLHPRELVSLPF